MASTWHVWTCNNHGIVRHTTNQYKCKRLDCIIAYTGCLKFDYETDTWKNCTNLSESDLEPVKEKLIETKSRAEYRSTLAQQTNEELCKIQDCLLRNVETHSIGPIFHSEIIAALKERI